MDDKKCHRMPIVAKCFEHFKTVGALQGIWRTLSTAVENFFRFVHEFCNRRQSEPTFVTV